ncbi:MAG TPA: hypothetical protein VGS13_03695, partial [Stellaceae bacterium]|nr:hypothetical protein [Stellaceae bacterium]
MAMDDGVDSPARGPEVGAEIIAPLPLAKLPAVVPAATTRRAGGRWSKGAALLLVFFGAAAGGTYWWLHSGPGLP